MYVAQVGVASILLSGSDQCFLRSVDHLYSVPDMTLEKLFQAGYEDTSDLLSCLPIQVCT